MDVFKDILDQIHTEIIGANISGKSELLKSVAYTAIKNKDDSEVVVIDPGYGVLSIYNNCEACNYCYAWEEIPKLLGRYANEVENRYLNMYMSRKKNCDEHNVYILIDNYDNVVRRGERIVEESISKIAKKGRAANVHLIIAVGNMKCVKPDIAINMTCRIDLIPTPKGVSFRRNGTLIANDIPMIDDSVIRKAIQK